MKPIKNLVTALSLAAVFAALSPVSVQAQSQGAQKGAAADSNAKPVAAKRSRSRSNVDARHCLKFPTNMEIHRCAHKYL
jgi:hypothetical protein